MKLTRAIALTAVLAACSQDQDSSRQFPLAPSQSLGETSEAAGQVFTASNQVAGNAVLVYNRAKDGTLTAAGSYATGGLGTGGGLGNQTGITLDDDRRLLAVVNAGSHEISVFRVNDDGSLYLTAKQPSGGTTPISVTISEGLLYVLNAGNGGNITGFRLSDNGDLTAIPNSTRPLSGTATGPAQISFDPEGQQLVVTEKATNTILNYRVDSRGLATGPVVTPASGRTPFGFGFTHSGTLVVSEAFPGVPDGSAVSSYLSGRNGAWSVVTASAPTTETAACWIVVTENGRYAYTTNAGSGTISGFSINKGALTLLNSDGVTGNVGVGTGPTDMALSRDSRFLYALAGAAHELAAFAVGSDGSLTRIPVSAGGLPIGTNGLAAR